MDELTSFERDGYVHLSKVLPEDECERLLQCFRDEVKTDQRPMLRQRCVTYQTHRMNRHGFVENALLDVHRRDVYRQQNFAATVQRTLSHDHLQSTLQTLLGPNPVLVQTMYFETSKGTPEHFDCHFIAVPNVQCMLGAWIALEDIPVEGGQFYVYPGSHDHQFATSPRAATLRRLFDDYEQFAKIAVHGHQGDNQRSAARAAIACKRILRDLITAAGWPQVSPAMRRGDVILFSAGILHGSHVPRGCASRNSLTAHFVNQGQTSIQYGAVREDVAVRESARLRIHISARYTYQNLGWTPNLVTVSHSLRTREPTSSRCAV